MTEMTKTSFKYKRILVPLDGSKLAEQALTAALIIAESLGAKVHCLQVVTGLNLNLDPYLNQRVLEAREYAANLYLESLRDRFAESKVNVETSTIAGPVAQTVIQYATENGFDLIVMSSHGHTGLKRWVYGDVAIKILRRAPCDTLLVRPLLAAKPFSKNRILVPLDGSQWAEKALKPAIALASAQGMELVLLRVSPLVHTELEPMSSRHMFNDIEAKARHEAESYLQDVRATVAISHSSVSVEAVTGTPAAAIVDYARKHQVDMIVMSSHGRTGPGLWLMGSISEKVLRKATCATLIVRAPVDHGEKSDEA